MTLDDERRKKLKAAAKLGDRQIEQAVGKRKVTGPSSRRAGRREVARADAGVRQVMEDVTIISAHYNEIQRSTDRDARETAPAEDLKRDTEALDAMIADDYRLTNPFGKSEGKAETINKILSGTIRPEMFGEGGFESPEHELQVHAADGQPHTAVSHGVLKMKGAGLAKFKKTGDVKWRDLTGAYRTTHTFVFRDGRWQITATSMTQIPAEPEFAFVGED